MVVEGAQPIRNRQIEQVGKAHPVDGGDEGHGNARPRVAGSSR
jgi:hypothetical protein